MALAEVVILYSRGQATGRRRLRVQLGQAESEIALLREELAIKDGRWQRARTRRRPHYTSIQRMRILQLRAARGWTLETTARVFLVDLQTLSIWMRRLDERGDRALVRTIEPVNRYPDLVRHLVRELKRLFPAMGFERMANVLARAGLHLGATTIRRMVREAGPPPDESTWVSKQRRRRVVAKYPGHTWHVDLTTMPTRAGFWVPWLPFSLPQRWPFCWWIAVAIDQMLRGVVGSAVFGKKPSSVEVQTALGRAICAAGTPPRYVVTDKGKQFWCRSFKRWCKRRGIRPRFGAIGQPASIALVERFIRSMKQEALRQALLPTKLAAMQREVTLYIDWHNEFRQHRAAFRAIRVQIRRASARGARRSPRVCGRHGRDTLETSPREQHSPAPEARFDTARCPTIGAVSRAEATPSPGGAPPPSRTAE